MRNRYIILQVTVMYLNADSILLSLLLTNLEQFFFCFFFCLRNIEPIYMFIKIFLKMKATLHLKDADLYAM